MTRKTRSDKGHPRRCASGKTAPIDMIGQVFGGWTVLGLDSGVGSQRKWLCRCVCGVERPVNGVTLRNGVSSSCGCLRVQRQKEKAARELEAVIGESSGFLTVERGEFKLDARGKPEPWVHCRCACGNEVTTRLSLFVRSVTKSCGCYNSIASRERANLRNDKLKAKGETWIPLQPRTCSRCGCTKPGEEFVFYQTEKYGRKKAPYCLECDNPEAKRATFLRALAKSAATREARMGATP